MFGHLMRADVTRSARQRREMSVPGGLSPPALKPPEHGI
jgi:hypothetical protein